MLRIFGRTTLVSQFMVRSEWRSNRLEYMAPWTFPGKPALDSCFDALSSREPVTTSLENALPVYLACNCGLFRGLFRTPDALRQRGNHIGHRIDGFSRRPAPGIEAAAQRIDQRGANHRTVGILRNRTRSLRGAD